MCKAWDNKIYEEFAKFTKIYENLQKPLAFFYFSETPLLFWSKQGNKVAKAL